MLAVSAPWAAGATPAGGTDIALAWLSSVDHDAYSQSWVQAGSTFRSRISEAEWTKEVAQTRQPLGNMMSRKLVSQKEATSLPGVPDGHYDVLTFDASFTARHDAVETVILADEPAGWKVDGYFIR